MFVAVDKSKEGSTQFVMEAAMALVVYVLAATFGSLTTIAVVSFFDLRVAIVAAPFVGSFFVLLLARLIAHKRLPDEQPISVGFRPQLDLARLGAELRRLYSGLLVEPLPSAISRPLRALAAREGTTSFV